MPEQFWHKFCPTEWLGDPQLSLCSPEARGIWIDACSVMMINRTDRISGTDEEIARLCRCLPEQTRATHEQISRTKAATTHEQNGIKTWVCRRFSRELRISKLRGMASSSRFNKQTASYETKEQHLFGTNGADALTLTLTSNSKTPSIGEIFDVWNGTKGVRQCLIVSDKRRRLLEIRMGEKQFIENWHAAITRVSLSNFCCGENERGWKANFDWFIRPDTVTKIMEGCYDNRKSGSEHRAQGGRVIADRNAGTANAGVDYSGIHEKL